jgi:hypothetical protein
MGWAREFLGMVPKFVCTSHRGASHRSRMHIKTAALVFFLFKNDIKIFDVPRGAALNEGGTHTRIQVFIYYNFYTPISIKSTHSAAARLKSQVEPGHTRASRTLALTTLSCFVLLQQSWKINNWISADMLDEKRAIEKKRWRQAHKTFSNKTRLSLTRSLPHCIEI